VSRLQSPVAPAPPEAGAAIDVEPSEPVGARRAVGRKLASHSLTLIAGLAASAPLIVSMAKASAAGWQPAGDEGIIAMRAYDVLSSHSPLVGQYSYAGIVTGHVTHSLGPMLYWLLALPARFGTATTLAVAIGIANTLAVLGSVALARRRGGLVLMFAAAVAIAVMCQSLSPERLHDIWNPSAGIFPLLLLIFLCWSLACGDVRLLPLTAIVASYEVQCELTFLPPTLGLLAVGLGGLAVWRWRRRGSTMSGPRPWRWALAAFIATLLCWSLPLADQLEHKPGNITAVIDTATTSKTTLGASVGWHAVVRATGITPWWFEVPRTPWDRKQDVRVKPATTAIVSTLILLAALALAALVGLRRRRGELVAGGLIGLLLCGALAAVAAATPAKPILAGTLGYTLWWASPAGLFVWLFVAWAAWLALGHAAGMLWSRASAVSWAHLTRERLARVTPRAGLITRVALSLGGIGAAAAAGSAVAAAEGPDEHLPEYKPIGQLAAGLERAVPSGHTVRVLAKLGGSTFPIRPAIAYTLRRHGDRVLEIGAWQRLGYWYELGRRGYEYRVYVDDGTRPPPVRPVAQIAEATLTNATGPHVLTVWLARERGLHAVAAHRAAKARPARRR
jgi:hypothetical protein